MYLNTIDLMVDLIMFRKAYAEFVDLVEKNSCLIFYTEFYCI